MNHVLVSLASPFYDLALHLLYVYLALFNSVGNLIIIITVLLLLLSLLCFMIIIINLIQFAYKSFAY